jgi:nucleotide-binding universal stress UspA family protein
MQRILVGFDGTDAGRRALDRAAAEAQASHGRVTVVSVANVPLSPDVPRYFGTLDDISSDEGAALAPPPDLVDHLNEAREHLASHGIDADLAWAAGEPGHEIVEMAKQVRANVIVVGEHHHGFLSGLFGGDVDAEVEKAAGCDVILA